jgi:hypothetical protein
LTSFEGSNPSLSAGAAAPDPHDRDWYGRRMAATTGAPPATEKTGGSSIYVAFVPWILFSVIDRRDSLLAASVVALVASVLIAAPGLRAGRPKTLELGAVASFAAFTVVALIADPGVDDTLTRYARAIAAALLALVALGSLLSTPFTEQYARERVDRRYWSSPVFAKVNRELTLMWGLVFLALVPSHIVAGAIDTRRGNTIFNWVIPIALIVLAAKRTERVSAQAGEA